MEDIVIRKATPADREDIVELAYIASKSGGPVSLYDLLFGEQKSKAVLRALYDLDIKNNPFHYSGFIVAQVGNQVAGALCTYIQGKKPFLNWRVLPVIFQVGMDFSDFLRFFRNGLIMAKVLDEKESGTMVIEHLAVFVAFRNKGVAGKLITWVIRQAEQTGQKKLALSVITGNMPARQLYEKMGFKHVRTSMHPEFRQLFDFPGIDRMELKIC